MLAALPKPSPPGGFSVGSAPSRPGSASCSRRFGPGFTSGGQVSTSCGVGVRPRLAAHPPSAWHKPCRRHRIGRKTSRAFPWVQNNLGKQRLLRLRISLLRGLQAGSRRRRWHPEVPYRPGPCPKVILAGGIRSWALSSQGVASGSRTKPPCAARD